MTTNPTQPSRPFRRRLANVILAPLVMLTLGALFAPVHWIADVLSSGRPQQVIALLAAALVCLAMKQFWHAGASLACAALHLLLVSGQLLPPLRDERSRDSSIRLMTVNVLTSNKRYQTVIDEIRQLDPDVFALLEINGEWKRVSREAFKDDYPNVLAIHDDFGNFGIALFSKSAFSSEDTFQLNEQIDSLEVVTSGVRLIATHPLPPLGQHHFHSRNRHLAEIAKRVTSRRTANPDQPIAVLGDLNVTPWSPNFTRFESESGLKRARVGLELRPTWHLAGSSFLTGLALDHVLASDHFWCEHYDVGPDVGSDHRGVCVTLKY
ncbi:MAG: endonuclease/exonuclease/phosphatase family protein [Planctomycetota bacterium]